MSTKCGLSTKCGSTKCGVDSIKYMVNFMSEDEIRVERGHFDDRCGALLCTSADGLGPKHALFRIIQ